MTTRQRRRLPLEHVLIAADATDLDAVRALVALLPTGAYGQVLVAVGDAGPSADELASWLQTPPRMNVTRVAGGDAGLSQAVTAWMAEWIPDEPTTDRLVSVWMSERVGIALEASCDELVCPVARL